MDSEKVNEERNGASRARVALGAALQLVEEALENDIGKFRDSEEMRTVQTNLVAAGRAIAKAALALSILKVGLK
jgi:hypothetical protein